jgi:hypothetical protein
MANETTSTFTVTVTHGGPKREFGELFKSRGRKVTAIASKMEDTATKKIPPKALYSDEQKMTRLLIKLACEAAGLKYASAKNREKTKELYEISYGYVPRHRKKAGAATIHVSLLRARVQLEFPNGLGSEGKASIFETGKSYYRTGEAPESFAINLATPDISDKFTELFKKWGLESK